MGNGMARRSRRGKRGLWAVVMMAVVLLACGASRSFKPLPSTTLPPGVAPFEIVTLGAGKLQSRAGRNGVQLWEHSLEPSSETGNGNGVLLAAGGLIFHRDQEDSANVVEAFSAATGAQVWRLNDCPGYDDTFTANGGLVFATCGASAVTPVPVSDDTLYVLDAATGTIRWQVHGEHFRAVAGDLVITQTSSGLAARTLVQGDLRWSRTIAFPPLALPAFDVAVTAANGLLYLSPDGQYVVALRIVDGSTRWETAPLTSLANAPVSRRNLSPSFAVAAVTARTVIARDVSLAGYAVVALDATTGRVNWHLQDDTPGSTLTSLVGSDGAIFVDSFVHPNDPVETLRRLDPGTGSQLWSTPGPILRSPPLWYAADALYASDSPQLLAFRASDGTRLFGDQGIFPTEVNANADVIVVADGRNLYLLSALDGKQIWEAQDAGLVQAAPIILPVSG